MTLSGDWDGIDLGTGHNLEPELNVALILPDGRSLEWWTDFDKREKLPYALHGDAQNWDAEQEAHGRAMLAFWTRFAPNLAEHGTVLDAFTRSLLDTERSLPNMCRGDLLVGSLSYGQVAGTSTLPRASSSTQNLASVRLSAVIGLSVLSLDAWPGRHSSARRG
jgi:hypothetical protein